MEGNWSMFQSLSTWDLFYVNEAQIERNVLEKLRSRSDSFTNVISLRLECAKVLDSFLLLYILTCVIKTGMEGGEKL